MTQTSFADNLSRAPAGKKSWVFWHCAVCQLHKSKLRRDDLNNRRISHPTMGSCGPVVLHQQQWAWSSGVARLCTALSTPHICSLRVAKQWAWNHKEYLNYDRLDLAANLSSRLAPNGEQIDGKLCSGILGDILPTSRFLLISHT